MSKVPNDVSAPRPSAASANAVDDAETISGVLDEGPAVKRKVGRPRDSVGQTEFILSTFDEYGEIRAKQKKAEGGTGGHFDRVSKKLIAKFGWADPLNARLDEGKMGDPNNWKKVEEEVDAARTMVKREADADDVEAKKEAARKDEVMVKVRDVRWFSLLWLISSTNRVIRG